MAKSVGRKFVVKRDGVPVANVRTRSLSINREQVDATDDDSNGWREHLGDVAQADVSMSVEGVFSDDSILQEALNTDQGLVAHTLETPSGATIDGDFAMTSFELEAAYNEVATYTFEIQSSGPATFNPAP